MKSLVFMFVVIGTVLIFWGCQEESALSPDFAQSNQGTNSLAKPLPYLIGTTNTPFNLPPLPDPGGSDLLIFWKGTIDFGGDEYGLYFLSHGEPRDFSQASPFYEDFVIYNLTDETIYMKGWNAGVVTYANKDPEPVKFHANGKIVEAYGPFKDWQDRNIHIKGLVYWAFDDDGLPTGFPEKAEGTFRIN
jgi:hypothetical protein